MYSQYDFHASTSSSRAIPFMAPSNCSQFSELSLKKPFFLIQQTEGSHLSKPKGAQISKQTDWSRYNLSEESTKRLTQIDSNPFFKHSNVYLQPVKYRFDETRQGQCVKPTVSEFDKEDQEQNNGLRRQIEGIYQYGLSLPRNVEPPPQPKKQQEPNSEEKQSRIKQILAEVAKRALAEGTKPEEDKSKKDAKNNRPSFTQQGRDSWNDRNNEYPDYEGNNNSWTPITEALRNQFQYQQNQNRWNPVVGRQAASIIQQLAEEPYFGHGQNKDKMAFVSSQVEEFPRQENHHEEDPIKYWAQAAVQIAKQGSNDFRPSNPPNSITVRGQRFDFVPVY